MTTKQMYSEEGHAIVLNAEGFRVYTPDVPIRIGDIVTMSGSFQRHTHHPFDALIVAGSEMTKYGRMFLVCRPHCTISTYAGEKHKDAQAAVQFERLTVSEEEFRSGKFVAFTTGHSGQISNRCRPIAGT